MKLAVFGATGKTGREVVRQAFEAGHEVTAFVRSPEKLRIEHERLRVVQGDVLRDPAAIEEAVRGQDAVISALGSGNETLTTFARHAIPAMERTDVKRIVSLVGAGVPDPADEGSLGRTFMRALMKVVARDVLADAERHTEMLRESGLDWTLVRPPRLTEGPRRGEYRHAPAMKLGPKSTISRADLADFMLNLAGGGGYVRQAPMVSD